MNKCPYCGERHVSEPPYRKQISNTTYVTNIPNLLMAQAIKEATATKPKDGKVQEE